MSVLLLPWRRSGRRNGTGQRRIRWARMLGHGIIWSGLGAVALAVGLGVQLGDSAVDQIDPLYFQGAAVHPRDRGAALDPNALPGPIISPYTQAYGWAQSQAPAYAETGGADYPYAPEPAVTVHRLSESEWEEVPSPSMAPWPPGQVTEDPQIERYASYPIEEKPPAPVAEAGAPPQPRPPAEQLSVAPVLVYDR
jgi:hypothetical protein